MVKIVYPCRMRSRITGLEVMMTDHGRGTVINRGDGGFPVGHFSAEWNMHRFLPVKPSLFRIIDDHIKLLRETQKLDTGEKI